MKSSAPVKSSRAGTGPRRRTGLLGPAVLTALLLTMTACGGGAPGQSRGDSGAMEPRRVRDYDKMVKEYEQQNGPTDEGFWNEVYKDSDY